MPARYTHTYTTENNEYALSCKWRVRAACHHAEAVRDEEEVGDRDGVAIGLEHTLLIWYMDIRGTAMCYAYGMQMKRRWNAYCTYG